MSNDKTKVLRRSPLFELLSSAELQVLADLSRPLRFAAGERIFAEGDVGDSLFVLGAGEVMVSRHETPGAPLAVLGPPAAFGEMALVDREHRSATVTARTEV